jgi:hypothetical protein
LSVTSGGIEVYVVRVSKEVLSSNKKVQTLLATTSYLSSLPQRNI